MRLNVRRSFAGVVLALLAGPPLAATELGAGVDSDLAVTPVAAILADPDAFLGETVRIEGEVLDVCPMKGCWMEVGTAGESLQVKVEDDVIVFPADAKGRIARAQGVVEAIELDRERYLAYLAHLAEERGQAFDAETAEIGDGPYRIVRLRGTGAEIPPE